MPDTRAETITLTFDLHDLPTALRESWRIAVDLLERCRRDLPHAWVTGDDEPGRPAEFRGRSRRHDERSILDVPRNTSIRDLECRRPRRRRAGRGRKPEVAFRRADAWAARRPEGRWTRLTVRDGERRPIRVDALTVRVRSQEERRVGPEERGRGDVSTPPPTAGYELINGSGV